MHRRTVMISSTYLDLQQHREQVRKGCERAGFAPHDMMEHLTAMDANAVQASMAMVERGDVYVCILAHRYGYVPDGSDISITEMEYNRAEELAKPRLVFFIHKDHPITIDDVETGAGAEKLKALRERIGTERVAQFFTSAEDLRGHVHEALTDLKEELDAAEDGADEEAAAKRSVKALHRFSDIPAPPEPYIAHPYTLMQARELVGRQGELSALTDWITVPSKTNDASIFALVAIGGMGKSALAWKWFKDIAPQEMRPLAGRLWWSFYESDASFESFLTRALAYVSDVAEEAVAKLTWEERANRLLSQLNREPYLLVLDGLERALIAYARLDAARMTDHDLDERTANRVAGAVGLPESAAQSFIGKHQLRQTADPRAGAFLRKLAGVEPSRVLITTRLYPSELQLPNGRPGPGCAAQFLRGLSDDDALGLWRALGVTGSRAELVPVFRSVESHPLLIQALASEVASYRAAPGDFAQWRANHPEFNPADLPLVQSRTHILDFALRGLSDALREILTTIAAFRMPATYDTLKALLISEGKPCVDAKVLDRELTELEDRGLVGWDREANRYDLHPIVRGVVWSLARKEDQQAVLGALEAHFEPMAVPEDKDVESLADLAPAIERYNTLVGLGRFDDAFSLFTDRLSDGLHFVLAATRESAEMLEGLFPDGIGELPALSDQLSKGKVLHFLAMNYRHLGRLDSAAALSCRAAEIAEQYSGSSSLSLVLQTFGYCLRKTGAQFEAEEVLRRSLILARQANDAFSEAIVCCMWGEHLISCGESSCAATALARARAMFQRMGSGPGQSHTAASQCRQSLFARDFTAAQGFADLARSFAEVARNEMNLIEAALCQGETALGQCNFISADARLHEALSRVRAVSSVELELPALIALAQLACAQNRLNDARAHLEDVWDSAEQGPYTLELADAYNTLADIERAEGNTGAAVDAATKAYLHAWCDGPPYAYHYGLEKAKAHLAAFGAPEPDLPPFDESKFEPLPEVDIIPPEGPDDD